MNLTVRLAGTGLITLLTLLLTACETPRDVQGPVLSVYATRDDARAMASGHFGSVPVALEYEKVLTPVSGAPCDPLVIQVRTSTGTVGWSVLRSFSQPPCVPAAEGQSSSACNCTSR